MSNYPSLIPPERPTKPRKKNNAVLWFIIAVIVIIAVLILLLVLLPGLFGTIALVGLILSIIGFTKGRVPLLGFQGRTKSTWLGISMLALLVVAGNLMDPADKKDTTAQSTLAPIVTSTESATPTPSESPSPSMLEDFVGAECESDDLVMDQADETLYCDENLAKMLVWTSQDDHDKAVVLAEKKAAEEKKKAEEKAAAEIKEAEAKAAAKKKAEAEKAASDKKRAEKRAAEKTARNTYTPPPVKKAPTSAYYANCSAVRAAGAAPIYAGDPGYSRKLDRDGDGVACE